MIAALHTKLGLKRSELKKDEGFTLIELLVVILIIGVLAAIAIPVFLGQQAQAQEAAAHANLANAKIAVTAQQVGSDKDLEELGFPKDGSVVVASRDDDAGTFCLETADEAWHLSAADSNPTAGACPA